jgi:hypothetical protein
MKIGVSPNLSSLSLEGKGRGEGEMYDFKFVSDFEFPVYLIIK